MSIEENKRIARRLLEDIWQKGDRTTAQEIIADDIIIHGTVPGQPPGPEGQLYAANFFRSIFPDLQWTIEDLVAEGDKVVLRWTMRGTHQGPLGDIAPTGKQVMWTGIDFLRIQNRKVAEIWHNEDYFGLVKQIQEAGSPAQKRDETLSN